MKNRVLYGEFLTILCPYLEIQERSQTSSGHSRADPRIQSESPAAHKGQQDAGEHREQESHTRCKHCCQKAVDVLVAYVADDVHGVEDYQISAWEHLDDVEDVDD